MEFVISLTPSFHSCRLGCLFFIANNLLYSFSVVLAVLGACFCLFHPSSVFSLLFPLWITLPLLWHVPKIHNFMYVMISSLLQLDRNYKKGLLNRFLSKVKKFPALHDSKMTNPIVKINSIFLCVDLRDDALMLKPSHPKKHQ